MSNYKDQLSAFIKNVKLSRTFKTDNNNNKEKELPTVTVNRIFNKYKKTIINDTLEDFLFKASKNKLPPYGISYKLLENITDDCLILLLKQQVEKEIKENLPSIPDSTLKVYATPFVDSHSRNTLILHIMLNF